MSSLKKKSSNSGFSLLELIIAMAITMVLVTAAATLLASGLRMRTRENQKSDALADTQRALNIMSREIANAGFNLNNNGIVVADSGANKIRVRSNLNKYEVDNPDLTSLQRNSVMDTEEDITYYLNEAENTKYLVRRDEFGSGSTVLANRIDSMNIYYFDQKVIYTVPSGGAASDISFSSAQVSKENAKYIVIAISVTLDAVGTPGSDGYQPGHSVLLCSDVTLRNWDLRFY
ncbi:MAG TPA: prepilin-type N-terminal cleavage/methylation domain-containing protein [Pyrinomonadaceae bacterium]|jgi:type II secretory pathway pseudopilin PulG|nr:prepilin-type N-terminal cleavage/methylation domain-containing protein [Pyrinomonadaceae bacterium]